MHVRLLVRLLILGCLLPVACARPTPTPAAPPAQTAGCARAAPPSSAFALAVLGSGGPRNFGRAASGYLVYLDGVARILIDAGPGALVRLGELGVDLHRLDLILLTHLHVDHSGDLPGFVKARDVAHSEALRFRIFGPSGAGDYPGTAAFVDRLFGPHGAFAYLPKFRNELQLDAVDLPIAEDAPVREILREADLRVTSIAVDHGDVPAVAFRVEHAGHAVVVSGDLASKNDNLARLAEGADLLVYDTAVLDPPGSPPRLYALHTAPARIGEVAAMAHARSLLLSHVTPGVDEAQDAVRRAVGATFTGPTRFAHDCLRIDLAQ